MTSFYIQIGFGRWCVNFDTRDWLRAPERYEAYHFIHWTFGPFDAAYDKTR